jgi:hypothetical protein
MQLQPRGGSGSRVTEVDRAGRHGPAWEREWAEAEATDRAEAARARSFPYSVGGLILLGAALLSAGAASVHFAVTKDNFEEYTLFGVLFVATALAQLGWAAAVLVRPWRALLVLGAVFNLGVAAVWALDRTVGMPIGPEHWEASPFGFGDTVTAAFEVLIAIGCVLLLRRRLAGGVRRPAARAAVGALALAAGAVTILALLSAFGVATSVLTPAA